MTLREVMLLTAFLAFLAPGPAVAGGPIKETWYDETGDPFFMESFDGGLNWYGWYEGRKLHFIEPNRGPSELWKGRDAYDADNLVGMSCEAWLWSSMDCQ